MLRFFLIVSFAAILAQAYILKQDDDYFEKFQTYNAYSMDTVTPTLESDESSENMLFENRMVSQAPENHKMTEKGYNEYSMVTQTTPETDELSQHHNHTVNHILKKIGEGLAHHIHKGYKDHLNKTSEFLNILKESASNETAMAENISKVLVKVIEHPVVKKKVLHFLSNILKH